MKTKLRSPEPHSPELIEAMQRKVASMTGCDLGTVKLVTGERREEALKAFFKQQEERRRG